MNTPAYRGFSRRQVIQIAAAGAIAAPFVARRGFAAGTPTVVNSIRSLTNPYHATWNKGGLASTSSGDTAVNVDSSGAVYQANLNGDGTLQGQLSHSRIARSGDETSERE